LANLSGERRNFDRTLLHINALYAFLIDVQKRSNSKNKIMHWKEAIDSFITYLKLEKSLAKNSCLAYEQDIKKLWQFILLQPSPIAPLAITKTDLQRFITYLNELGIAANSQARILSAIEAFYQYFILAGLLAESPVQQIARPSLGRKLPHVLAVYEIEMMLNAIDLSTAIGMRNRALLETLYSTGLRVSELIALKQRDIYFEEHFLRIIGKGNKERLVPIGSIALKYLRIYLNEVRCHASIQPAFMNHVFINKRGTALSRVMVFILIKALAEQVGLKKRISPHTFRHSFASHLLEGGADLRAIQQMLGHETITTTEIYTHLDHAYLQQIIKECHPMSKLEMEQSS